RFAADDERAVAVAEARARGHDLVAGGQVGVAVEREGGDLVTPLERGLVQGFDVLKDVRDRKAGNVEQSLGEGVEHNRTFRRGIVRDWTFWGWGGGGGRGIGHGGGRVSEGGAI